jgi:hypothetical protein
MKAARRGLALASVAVLALLGVAADAGADAQVDVPYTEIVESHSSGGNCAYYHYFLQFPAIKGASSYIGINQYHGNGFLLNYHGPPFPDDDEQGDGFHFTAPQGAHRFGATAGSGPGACPSDSLKHEWTPRLLKARFTDKKGRIVGSALDADGRPVNRVKIAITGKSSASAHTNRFGVYSVRVKKGHHRVRAPEAFCVVGIRKCTNEKSVKVNGTEEVKFVRRKPPLVVTGTVRDEFRRGLGGVRMRLAGAEDDVDATDAGGRYRLRVSDPGTYELSASVAGRPHGPYERYYIVRNGRATNGTAADVTLNDDTSPLGVDWELDRRLQFDLFAPSNVQADGFSRLVATVRAATQRGDPAPRVQLRVDPAASARPRAVMCTVGAGSRPLWPSLNGSSVSPAGLPFGPATTTGSDGSASFRVFPGTEPGRLGMLVNRRGDTSTVLSSGINFAAAPSQPISAQALRAGLQQTGPKGTTFFGDQSVIFELLAQRQGDADPLAGFDAAPVRAGSKRGTLFFTRGAPPPIQPDGTLVPTTNAFVFDNTLLQRITAVPTLPNLRDWAAGQPVVPDRRDGRTFLGWPIPTVTNGGLGTCLDGVANGAVIFEAHSPVRLLVKDSRGRRLGTTGGGKRFNSAPGVSYRKGGDSFIVAPRGPYKLTVTGTGKGPVTLAARSRAGVSVARFRARKGAHTTLSVPNGALPRSFRYGGKRVRSRTGMPLIVRGLPHRLRRGKRRRIAIRVTDATGRAVPFATLRASGRIRLSRRTNAKGRLRVKLPAPRRRGRVTFVVRAPDLLSQRVRARVTAPRKRR